VLDGQAVAAAIREDVRPASQACTTAAGRPPGLGIVLVGDDPASEIYVRNKLKSGADAGFWVDLQRLPGDASLDDLLALVARPERSDRHDGILVQSPLPVRWAPRPSSIVFDAIDPAKDVDGFNPVNVGLLVQNRARLAPCTPSGVIELLGRSGIAIAGAAPSSSAAARSLASRWRMLLLHRDATVTICHSKHPRPARDVARRPTSSSPRSDGPGSSPRLRQAGRHGGRRRHQPCDDAALWSPRVAGRVEAAAAEFDRRGSVVVGDVHPGVAEVAGALTPVPGGVGPLTIAMLLHNTLVAASARVALT
jgi:methylenetetrahydrofolate dehydrogenase (NADP+) / methenyltetrahydrofolate cyclohydrolase